MSPRGRAEGDHRPAWQENEPAIVVAPRWPVCASSASNFRGPLRGLGSLSLLQARTEVNDPLKCLDDLQFVAKVAVYQSFQRSSCRMAHGEQERPLLVKQ